MVNIRLDADEASRLGVNRGLLSLQLAGSFNGRSIASVWENGRSLPVTLYAEGLEGDMPYTVIGDQMVASALPGVSIPLRQVASVEPDWQVAQLHRWGGESSVSVYADTKMGISQPQVMEEVEDYVNHLELPEGAHVQYSGLSSLNAVLGPEIAIAFFVACLILFVFLSMVFGTALVLTAFGTLLSMQSLAFLALGALAIVGAMTYTLGKHNYGYKGWGDLGVFLFFGLLSTMGSFYLQTQTLTAEAVLAAVAIALPNVGVLNLNNVRDMDNDLKHGKRTLASRLGKTGGKIYHALLLLICFVLFVCIGKYWVLCTLPVIIWHVWYIFRHDGHDLDLQMPVLMFTTLTIALLAIV